MTAYYNEIDPYAAQWLRNLIDAGHIAPGYVDERSIEDVYPSDLRGFTQCHFFAGIGVWSHALRSAGWSDDRPVWTGSCPCQPFSAAGKGAGFDDERHLWPAFHHLIKECNPAVVLGEQVASKDAGPWIDLVCDDLEALGYAFGAVPFPSAGVGAPHIRDRLYWMAYADGGARREGRADVRWRTEGGAAQPWSGLGGGGVLGRLGNHDSEHAGRHAGASDSAQREAGLRPGGDLPTPSGAVGWMAHADREAWGRKARHSIADGGNEAPAGGAPQSGRHGGDCRTGPTNGLWRAADWLLCRDGKWRPVESGTFPLVDGSAGGMGRVRADQERLAALLPRKDQGSRAGRLKGYGNAINAEAARVFIECMMECTP